MAYDVYPLPHLFNLVNPLTQQIQNIGTSHTLLSSTSLKKTLYIELYNEKWFDNPLKTLIQSFIYKRDTPQKPTESISSFPSVVKLQDETNTCPPTPLLESIDDNIATPPSPLTLHKSLVTTYCLFMQYMQQNKIKPRWFLAQMNHIGTTILKMNSSRTGNYHVTFLSRHPADKYLYDDAVRWWPE